MRLAAKPASPPNPAIPPPHATVRSSVRRGVDIPGDELLGRSSGMVSMGGGFEI
jgi:hypothetical protein